MNSRVERYARTLAPLTTAAVRTASAAKVRAREQALSTLFDDPLEARRSATAIKRYVLDHLRPLLLRFETQASRNGMIVHWAEDAQEACRIAIEIIRASNPERRPIVKGKSMTTEEIHLNDALEVAGFPVVETDLGEFVVQLDGDTPSHIVTPIIHKTREDVARTFHRHELGPYTENPERLTQQARAHLRRVFQSASVGISGVNFAVAETGRLVVVENEGNNRMCTTAVKTHIAILGLEKLLPEERHVPLFIELLTASATGQRVTTYVHWISGPRQADEPDGPDAVHLIILDNGRSQLLSSPYRDILRCIRCGACLNICPIFRQSSGHAYGHTYAGPLGAVLAPAKDGLTSYGDLAHASTLCGACVDACPVMIPIPDLLVALRRDSHAHDTLEKIQWDAFARMAGSRRAWRLLLRLQGLTGWLKPPFLRQWSRTREVPKRHGREFRRWWRERA
jgi:L-lactate dehydrogenase complex protein LldF